MRPWWDQTCGSACRWKTPSRRCASNPAPTWPEAAAPQVITCWLPSYRAVVQPQPEDLLQPQAPGRVPLRAHPGHHRHRAPTHPGPAVEFRGPHAGRGRMVPTGIAGRWPDRDLAAGGTAACSSPGVVPLPATSLPLRRPVPAPRGVRPAPGAAPSCAPGCGW